LYVALVKLSLFYVAHHSVSHKMWPDASFFVKSTDILQFLKYHLFSVYTWSFVNSLKPGNFDIVFVYKHVSATHSVYLQ